jgi:hypothetical protein
MNGRGAGAPAESAFIASALERRVILMSFTGG